MYKVVGAKGIANFVNKVRKNVPEVTNNVNREISSIAKKEMIRRLEERNARFTGQLLSTISHEIKEIPNGTSLWVGVITDNSRIITRALYLEEGIPPTKVRIDEHFHEWIKLKLPFLKANVGDTFIVAKSNSQKSNFKLPGIRFVESGYNISVMSIDGLIEKHSKMLGLG
jgi:hypothetical protein